MHAVFPTTVEESSLLKRAKLAPEAARWRPRRLLLCLDGVPFDLIEMARARGLFARFHRPTRLLSPFPTMTNIALSSMFDESAPLGYESLYFDRQTKTLAGGARKYIGRRTPDKIPSSYMRLLDYQEPLACEFLVYVAPNRVVHADFERFRRRFQRTAPDKDFFAFLKAVDGLLHICGPQALLGALEELDRVLEKICARERDRTEIVLFSDHGMNLVENRRVHVRTHLERHGYRIVSRLRAPRDVCIPAFGLCGYVAIYCDAREKARLAAHMAELEGVDFSVYGEGDELAVVGPRGRARIRTARPDAGAIRYRYQAEQGDPLELLDVMRRMRESGQLGIDGDAEDGTWYSWTSQHIYPDALANLYGSIFEPRVVNTADVLVSLRDGYYYGSSLFGRLVRLFATHGNALIASSSAFLMSTHREFPRHMRIAGACRAFDFCHSKN